MAKTKTQSWESVKVEYENALEMYRHYTGLRRQDMAFVTTVQAAALTIIGKNLLSLDTSNLLLSIIAFFVLLLGFNSERRITAYMAGYMKRANQIETDHDMFLLVEGRKEVLKRKLLISNTIIFPLYYFIFAATWVIVWIINYV
jgi:hypothetical protein